jgi:hypothetical protein
MQYTQTKQRRWKIPWLAQHIPQKLPTYTPAKTQVLEEWRPADVQRVVVCMRRRGGFEFVFGVAAREVEFSEVWELADSLVEGLEGDCFGDEGEV